MAQIEKYLKQVKSTNCSKIVNFLNLKRILVMLLTDYTIYLLADMRLRTHTHTQNAQLNNPNRENVLFLKLTIIGVSK